VGKAKNYLSIIAAAILLGLAISSCATQSNHLLALEITSPQSKSEVTTDVITISGIVSSSQAAVTINGRQVTVDEDGGFSTTVELDYGENTVVVSATAEGEEPVDKTVTITRVLDLEITSPEDNAEVTESPILVSGTVSDPLATVKVNDREVTVANDGTFSAFVELDYVKNTITVSATVDGQPPVTKTVTVSRVLVLELTSPRYVVEVTNDRATITGIVSPPSATVTVNGQEATVTRDGSFTITVQLAYGTNTIVVSATDPVTETVTIVRLLTLELTSPQNNEEVSESQITVSGIVSDPLVSVTVNDNEVEVAQDGTFSTTVELDYGENTIVVNATAEGEEPVTRTVTITRVLALEITSPEDNAEVTESPILIKGTVSDPLSTVTVNDREVEVAEKGGFSTTVSLDQGDNTITVSATVDGQEPVTKTVTVRYISPD
jgi:lipopolysaccharide export system protein LptA